MSSSLSKRNFSTLSKSTSIIFVSAIRHLNSGANGDIFSSFCNVNIFMSGAVSTNHLVCNGLLTDDKFKIAIIFVVVCDCVLVVSVSRHNQKAHQHQAAIAICAGV